MKPSTLMWLGLATGIAAIVGSALGHDVIVVAFAGGALFGKGYGVWEARR